MIRMSGFGCRIIGVKDKVWVWAGRWGGGLKEGDRMGGGSRQRLAGGWLGNFTWQGDTIGGEVVQSGVDMVTKTSGGSAWWRKGWLNGRVQTNGSDAQADPTTGCHSVIVKGGSGRSGW